MSLASEFAVSLHIRYAVEIVGLGRMLEHMSFMVWRGGLAYGNNVRSYGGSSQGGRPRLNGPAGPGESPGWRAVCDPRRAGARRIRPGTYCSGPIVTARLAGISYQ